MIFPPQHLNRYALSLMAMLALAAPAQAQGYRASGVPASLDLWAPSIGMTSYADDTQPKRKSKAKPAKKACAWPTEKEWNRCERVKTMPSQPSNCNHLLPKC
jgi:hypothetical protein